MQIGTHTEGLREAGQEKVQANTRFLELLQGAYTQGAWHDGTLMPKGGGHVHCTLTTPSHLPLSCTGLHRP
jgi:hypothetical protein